MSPATDVAPVPGYTPIRFWSPANQGCYARFRQWLRAGGYSDKTVTTYGISARLTFGLLDKPYWLIDPEADLDAIRQAIHTYYESEATCRTYGKGLLKLAAFLRHRQGKPPPPKRVNWSTFLAGLPDWLAADIRSYVGHRRRAWLPEEQGRHTGILLSPLTRFLRWAAKQTPLTTPADLTPSRWFAYLDERLAAGIKPVTLNKELAELQSFLRYLAELNRQVCDAFLAVERLPQQPFQPKDVPLAHLRRLFAELEAEARSDHAGVRRRGIMDKAWFLLMLHSGLRTGEVRRLRRRDLDLAGQRLRIEQSKGLKDRLVYLSQFTIAAIEAYLPLRGPLASDHLFVYRHRPLSVTYCKERLQTYGRRCGIRITPHRLRHSCATLLLNAGAPVLTVQAILGHKHIDTTMTYARLYNGTVAADYYRAMAGVEQRLQLCPTDGSPPMTTGQLVAMVDALSNGTLNDSQRQLVHDLRTGLLTLAERLENGT
jgi:integrase